MVRPLARYLAQETAAGILSSGWVAYDFQSLKFLVIFRK